MMFSPERVHGKLKNSPNVPLAARGKETQI